MKLTNQLNYKYRGVNYKQTRPQKCLINLFSYQIEKCDRENKTLTYRGVVYQIKQPKAIAYSISSAYVNKYRGNSYLSHIADLLSPSKYINQISKDNTVGDIDLIKH